MKGHKYSHSIPELSDYQGVAVLGHELGNVLHGLLGMAELLGESGLSPEQCRWLRAIELSGRQMASLIQSAWPRESATLHGIVTQADPVDGVEILEQVVISHIPAARTGNNRLILVLDPGLPRYWRQDACRVRQLLDNLVGNAIKFTQAGDIVIEAAYEDIDGQRDGAIRLRVSDTGPGLEATLAEQMFEARNLIDDAGAAESSRRGLGLQICQSIAVSMDGRITCSSPDGGGAQFEVLLPGIASAPAVPEFRSVLLERVRCELKLEKTLRKSVATFLMRLGVRFFDAGTEGLASPGQDLVLVISEVQQHLSVSQPCLLVTPCPQPGIQPRQRVLESPLLESSLASLLLEIALEWRSLSLRNENPGSAPRQR